MNIFQSLVIGVSGIQAQSASIDTISNNVANANTIGYKESVVNFQNLVNGDTSALSYSPSGVESTLKARNDIQGSILSTSSPTDLAITGNGFFSVSSTSPAAGNIFYTRAGSFSPDAKGDFTNSAGYFLQGWALTNGALPAALSGATIDPGTAVSDLSTVNLSNIVGSTIPTTNVSVIANLDSSAATYAGPPAYNPATALGSMATGGVAPQFTQPVTVIDKNNNAHTLTMGFLKTGTNTWAAEIYGTPPGDVTAPAGAPAGQAAAGTFTFNNDGTLASISPSLSQPITVTWAAAGSPPVTPPANQVTFNWGTAGQEFGTPGATVIGRNDGLEQFSAPFSVNGISQNGSQISTLKSISVGQDGTISGVYSDGSSRDLYKIPLVTFTDPDQLQSLASNVFSATANTGTANYVQANTGGAGAIESNSLENSNVDVAAQLTALVVAQNAYQSNAKSISTADTMMQDLIQMVI